LEAKTWYVGAVITQEDKSFTEKEVSRLIALLVAAVEHLAGQMDQGKGRGRGGKTLMITVYGERSESDC